MVGSRQSVAHTQPFEASVFEFQKSFARLLDVLSKLDVLCFLNKGAVTMHRIYAPSVIVSIFVFHSDRK